MRYFIDKLKAYRDDNIEIYSVHKYISIHQFFERQHQVLQRTTYIFH
jgi:hypothetical protein